MNFLYNPFSTGEDEATNKTSKRQPPECTFLSKSQFGEIFTSPTAPMDMIGISKKVGALDFKLLDLPFGLPSIYVLSDYRSARKALDNPASTKSRDINRLFYHMTNEGDNMIICDGHRWKHVRKSTRTAFSTRNVEKMVHSIDGIIERFMEEVVDPSIERGDKIDILAEMNCITANVIAEVAFDYKLPKTECDQFLQDLQTCWEEFGVKASENMLREFDSVRWMIPGIQRGKQASKRMYDFCEKMATVYRKKDAKDQQPHKIIHLILEDDEYANDGERFRDMVGYVIAGFDTTANTIAFALRELARAPEEQTKLRNALAQCSSDEERRHCPQLKLVIREILRMYPAIALGSMRQLEQDLVLPTEEIIPSGSIINTPFYAIQRNPEVFENPDAFLPSRWENPEKAQIMSMLTFSYGRRNCQGQALANAEIAEVLAKLCGSYEFKAEKEGEAQNILFLQPVGTFLSVKKVESSSN